MTKTTRREFIQMTVAGATALSFPFISCSGNKRPEKPNILFIAVDDLNDWTGCLGGHPDVKTPNIDRLAQRGLLFQNAYCPAPICNPSRTSLLSGIAPSTSGVYHNDQDFRTALPDIVTLPQHFMANGYHVIGGGKVFHRNDEPSWHEYFRQERDPRPENAPLNGIPRTGNFDWGPIDCTDDEMGDGKVTNWAAEELQKKHDKPFFLACGIFRPHLPWYVPKKYFDMYPLDQIHLPEVIENDLDDIPPTGLLFATGDLPHTALRGGDHEKILKYNKWLEAVQGYLACVSFADAMVGRVIDALDRSPYAENTVIILWGDHGWNLGEKEHWRKFALWEDTVENPLIIISPGITKPETRCTRPVSLIDLFPTLIDICGLSGNDVLEGLSLMPLLKNPQAKREQPAITTYGRNNHSLRSEQYRYIIYEDGGEELYDHQNDDNEWINLADKPEYAKIKEEFKKWIPKVNAPDAPVNPRSRAQYRDGIQGTLGGRYAFFLDSNY